MLSLHDQAWNLWQNSLPQHRGPATATDDQLARAKALIDEDATAILFADAMDIHTRWDDLMEEIAESNGCPSYDTTAPLTLIAYHPFEHRFAIVAAPEPPETH